MNFKYQYGEKNGIRSSSVVVSDELKEEIDAMFGPGQRSALLERAGWLLLALLSGDKIEIDEWLNWAALNMNKREWGRFCIGREHFGGDDEKRN